MSSVGREEGKGGGVLVNDCLNLDVCCIKAEIRSWRKGLHDRYGVQLSGSFARFEMEAASGQPTASSEHEVYMYCISSVSKYVSSGAHITSVL